MRKIKYCNLGENEILKLKSLLGIELGDTTKEAAINFVLEDVSETIKNYCNTDGVPDGLHSTMIRMAMDLYRNENLCSEESSLGSISSISEGDTSVNYRSSASEFKEHLLKDYKIQLNRYRRIRW
jgi:hypothetical protein